MCELTEQPTEQKKRPPRPKEDRKTSDTNLQYFLASICDLNSLPSGIQLGLRYNQSTDVAALLRKLKKSKLSSSDVARSHPNAIFSVLKEITSSQPPPFENEELLCIGQNAPEDLLLVYIGGLISSLPHDTAQLVYLLCRSLSKLVELSHLPDQSLTDVLIAFTPLMFPRCKTVPTFLKATRALLLMMEKTEFVFRPHLIHKGDSEDVLIELIESLTSNENDSGFETSADEESLCDTPSTILSDSTPFYTLTFDV